MKENGHFKKVNKLKLTSVLNTSTLAEVPNVYKKRIMFKPHWKSSKEFHPPSISGI